MPKAKSSEFARAQAANLTAHAHDEDASIAEGMARLTLRRAETVAALAVAQMREARLEEDPVKAEVRRRSSKTAAAEAASLKRVAKTFFAEAERGRAQAEAARSRANLSAVQTRLAAKHQKRK